MTTPPRCEILLATLNARYIHAAFGLRYLQANLEELQPRSLIREFDVNQRAADVAEALLAHGPRILGLGVYIWNVAPTLELVAILKRLRPDLILVLGGPEVSHEAESQQIVQLADYVITGEADLAFRDLCRLLLAGQRPPGKILHAALPRMEDLAMPYALYSTEDLAHRVVYVEASRGCPFTCEFCLSSLDIPVRAVALERFLPAMQSLLDRGLKHFKFVDRTFNLNLNTARAILEFFLARLCPGLFLHFEMVPDRLPEALREIIARFPPGVLQFEVGIQTFDAATGHNISRRQNFDRLASNLEFLRSQTGAHVHADLIVGLPGEDLITFGRGFDRLVAMRPQEIQVGILKRLRGTPIVRHDAAFGMIYSPHPPYELLANEAIPFPDMQRMRRFAKFWDQVANSGNFLESVPLLWLEGSPFTGFLAFSDWLHEKIGRTDGIALLRLVEGLFEFLCATGQNPTVVAATLWRDYTRSGRQEKVPGFLRAHLPDSPRVNLTSPESGLTKRQARHQQAASP